MTDSRTVLASIVLLFAAMVMSSPISAGSVILVWDSSSTATGYKVFSGTTSGTYAAPSDVGNTTQATIGTMADCATTFFAVKAYNSAGDSGYSNEVSSWPRPEIVSVTPLDAEPGSTLDVVITGNNYEPGASVAFSGSGIVVNSVTRNACGQITASVSVTGSAAFGPRDVSVVNSNGVTEVASGAFSVVGPELPDVQNLRRTDKQQ